MGGSHSSVKDSIVNNTINQTDIENTTKNIQESATNTLIKTASSCSSSVNQSNSCNLSGAAVAGNFTLGGKQSNKASVNFSCIQANSASSSMTDSMVNSIGNELGVLNGTEAAAKLNAAAESANKSGFGSWGGGSASSNVSTGVENNVTNSTKSIVENIFKKNLSNNFNSETVNECIGRTTQSNSIEAVGVKVGGNANVECDQSNTVEQVQECKQLTEAVNKTLSQTAQELGFKVNTSSETGSKSEIESAAKSKSEDTGPIQDLGNAVSGLLGLASLGIAGPFIIYACCICCCIILSIVSSMFVMKSSGGSMPNVQGSINLGKGANKMNLKFGKPHKGGYSDNSDVFEYLGVAGINLISDICSESSL